ncbi:MAG: DMT family transporter [Firmicutes bacterium]|nr:DMT family transporter [Bacillota bacterium]
MPPAPNLASNPAGEVVFVPVSSTRVAPVAAGVAMAVIFGLSFSFTKTALRFLTPMDLLALRFGLAALAMAILAFTGTFRLDFAGKYWRRLIPLALCEPVIYFLCETAGIQATSAAEAGMVIGAIPVVVAIMAAFFLGERPGLGQSFFIAASSLGIVLTFLGGPPSGGDSHPEGFLFLGVAVLAAGFYSVLSRRLAEEFSPLATTAVMMWMGAAVFIPLALGLHLVSGTAFPFRVLGAPPVLLSLAYLGLFSSVAAFFLLNYMFHHLAAVRTVIYTNLTTLVSILAGVFFLGEHLAPYQWLGGGLILLGVWGTNRFVPKGKSPSDGESTHQWV